MKVMQVHNHYRQRGGEDAVFDNTIRILREGGIEVCTLERDSQGMPDTFTAKAGALFSGVWSTKSKLAMREALEELQPDVVHVHNVYPMLSPSVFSACRKAGVPVVMTVHNYRLTCPIGTHYTRGASCTRCIGGHEQQCFLQNCRGNRAESAAYAARAWAANRYDWFKDGVDHFLAISDYLKDHLGASGFDQARITVVPNTVSIPESTTDAAQGEYALFCGRLSEEKGVDILIAAAHAAPEVPIHIVGDGPLRRVLRNSAPDNVQFRGRLSGDELVAAYRGARFFVAPAMWHEAFGLVVAEAMAHGLPVVASRMGAHSELVLDGERGHLFGAGDDPALARILRDLWNAPERCAAMGAAAHSYAAETFGEVKYLEQMKTIYNEVSRPGVRLR